MLEIEIVGVSGFGGSGFPIIEIVLDPMPIFPGVPFRTANMTAGV
jgi:hypothetical protein